MRQSAPQLDNNIKKQQLLLWRSGDKEAESEVRVAIIVVDGGLMPLFVFICMSESFKDPNKSTCLLRYSPPKFIIHSGGISLAHSETSHVGHDSLSTLQQRLIHRLFAPHLHSALPFINLATAPLAPPEACKSNFASVSYLSAITGLLRKSRSVSNGGCIYFSNLQRNAPCWRGRFWGI